MIIVVMPMSCMDPTPDYNECVQIETARCDIRAECKGDEDFDKEYPKFDGKTCIAYAKEHCRTREIGGDYTVEQLEACVTAIREDLTCDDLIPRGTDEIKKKNLWDCHFIDGRDAGPKPPEDADNDAGDDDAGTQ
jgi:hypothetical protein